MSAKAAPFKILAEIAKRSRDLAEGLPEQEQAVELWSGIGFMLGDARFVAPMGQITEILHLPRYTQIPGVKGWMYGVANVRGRLLPIMDLGLFFRTGRPSITSRNRRVLVLETDEIFSGLIVDGVMGMQYFSVESYTDADANLPDAIKPLLLGAYLKNDEVWNVFNAYEMIEDERFINVSQW